MVLHYRQSQKGVVGPIVHGVKDNSGQDANIIVEAVTLVDQSGNPVVIGGGGAGGQAVHGPDATGAAPTQPPVSVAGLGVDGKVMPLHLGLGGYIQSVSEGDQGSPAPIAGTLIAGIAPDTTLMQLLCDQQGTLLARTQGNVWWAETTAALAASATFTGTARDSGTAAGTPGYFSYFNALVATDQTGTATIEGSDDGTSWYSVAVEQIVANQPLALQVPVTAKVHRVVVQNGGTAQTNLVVKSGYTAT